MRRSARIAEKEKEQPATPPLSSYPEGPPASEFEEFVSRLNQEAFHSDDYSRIDDILVYSLFSSKHHLSYNRRLLPQAALAPPGTSHPSNSEVILASAPSFTNLHASRLYDLQKGIITEEEKQSEDTISKAASLIVSSMSDLFKSSDLPILRQ